MAVGAWMITWWVFEAVPIAVTSFIPLILFPLLGIMDMRQAAAPYAHPIVFLFMGGFMIALALEKHRLHQRIALNLIRITGTSGNGIILGFMISTGFISMWISNTATAMMMMPIALSVIRLLQSNDNVKPHELPKDQRNFALGLLLMVGYAATLGGMATIIGTPPNVVFAGLVDEFYREKLGFGNWMLIGVPVATMLLLSTHVIITRVLFPNNLSNVEGTDVLIKKNLQEMGALSKAETLVLIIFGLTSFFWVFQQALNTYILKEELLNDTNIAMTGGLLMFVTPVDIRNNKFLLTWKDTERMQWGILFLFGGGLCLASGLEGAGIIQAVGKWTAGQSSLSLWIILSLIVTTVVLSEFLSNVALVQIFVPVVFGIAEGMHINPVTLAVPVTLAASIGFMFPIATPANAIVFASGYIRMKDMIRAGLLLDLASILICFLASITLIKWVYG
jgi:sodium-dependent dicarboxylate transporter 2/3/5